MVEQGTFNPKVTGSIPVRPIKKHPANWALPSSTQPPGCVYTFTSDAAAPCDADVRLNHGIDDPKTALAEHVDQKRMLLLLDNFEQLLPAAPDVATLLARCPNLKLLVSA